MYECRPRGEILDVGCSTGWLEEATSSVPEFHVTGVESNPSSFARACELVPDADIRNASVLELPFADARFSGATMFEVLERLPRNTEIVALRELYRTLKPRAWLLVSAPYASLPAKVLDPAWYRGHRHYAHERLRGIIEESGFRVKRSFVRGRYWSIVTVALSKLFKHTLDSEFPFNGSAEAKRREEFMNPGNKAGLGNIFVLAEKV